MAKKKVYWFIEQLNHLGGTEMVTLTDIGLLKDDYDITLVLAQSYSGDSVFKLPEGIKIVSLNLPALFVNVEKIIQRLTRQCRFVELGLYFLYYTFFGFFARFHYRIKVKKMTEKDATLIAAGQICSSFMPRGRRVFYHYHFNAERLNCFVEWLPRRFSRKPDKMIFITRGSLDKAKSIREFKRIPLTMVYNPTRYEKFENYTFKGGKIVFIGRLADQKRPQMLIQIAFILKQDNVPFTLDIIGEGPLEDVLRRDIVKYGLEEQVRLLGAISDPLDNIRGADLAACTSSYEGYLLVTGEANSQSIPVISSNWGAGVNEVIKDGVSGYIIDSDDPAAYAAKIEELFNDQASLRTLKRSSYQYFVHSHSRQAIKEKWEEIIG